MVFSFFSTSMIGMTLEPEGARYVLMNSSGKSLGSTGFLPLDPGTVTEEGIWEEEHLCAQLAPWIKEEKLQNKQVAICIPTPQAFVRKIQVQRSARKDQRSLIQLEIQTGVRFPFEDPVYDFAILGDEAEQANEKIDVMVVAASRQMIMLYVRLLESLQLKVRAVGLSALAIYRVLAHLYKVLPQNLLIVHLAGAYVEIYLFREGVPEFMRSFSLQDMTFAVEEGAMNQWQWGDIQMEISRLLNFYQFNINEGQGSITDILVSGVFEKKGELIGYLQNSLSEVTVREVDVNSLDIEHGESGLDAFMVPLGLSMSNLKLKKHQERFYANMFTVDRNGGA